MYVYTHIYIYIYIYGRDAINHGVLLNGRGGRSHPAAGQRRGHLSARVQARDPPVSPVPLNAATS